MPPRCARWPITRRCIGLAEFMNFPGVIHRDPGLHGQAARLRGRAYRRARAAVVGARPERLLRGRHPHRARGDHPEEAREKLQKGLRVLIREGSVSKDMAALAPLLTP